MMTYIDSLVLLVIMAALAAIPSSSVALVVVRSVTAGTVSGIAVVAGIVLGDLVFVMLAVTGLHVIAESMAGLFLVIKYLGAIYLVWYGISLMRHTGSTLLQQQKDNSKNGYLGSFLSGLFLTLGDIKAIIFYSSLLPVFVELSSLDAAGILQLVCITVLGVGGVKTVYVLVARKLVVCLVPRHYENAANKTIGGMMIGAGGYLIIKA